MLSICLTRPRTTDAYACAKVSAVDHAYVRALVNAGDSACVYAPSASTPAYSSAVRIHGLAIAIVCASADAFVDDIAGVTANAYVSVIVNVPAPVRVRAFVTAHALVTICAYARVIVTICVGVAVTVFVTVNVGVNVTVNDPDIACANAAVAYPSLDKGGLESGKQRYTARTARCVCFRNCRQLREVALASAQG
jgi:hypothetical protein